MTLAIERTFYGPNKDVAIALNSNRFGNLPFETIEDADGFTTVRIKVPHIWETKDLPLSAIGHIIQCFHYPQLREFILGRQEVDESDPDELNFQKFHEFLCKHYNISRIQSESVYVRGKVYFSDSFITNDGYFKYSIVYYVEDRNIFYTHHCPNVTDSFHPLAFLKKMQFSL